MRRALQLSVIPLLLAPQAFPSRAEAGSGAWSHHAASAHGGGRFHRGQRMHRPAFAGGAYRPNLAANGYGVFPGYGWPYGPAGYGLPIGTLGNGLPYGAPGYAIPFTAPGFGLGYGAAGFGSPFGALGYGGLNGLLGYGALSGLLGYGWFDNWAPDTSWSGSTVQYVMPPPVAPPPPQVIVIGSAMPPPMPAAPGAMPDYSYVAGCQAIPNGYHCAAAAH